MRNLRSSIDLGTNTCLLLIAEWDSARQEASRVHADHATVVRLGQGVDRSRELQPAAMERTLACLRDYAEKVRAAGLSPAETRGIATSQARDARNGKEFFARVERETGFRFRIISGDEEGSLTFLGALLPGMHPGSTSVIDIGGGSTELIAQVEGKLRGQSLDVGSVRFTERFFHGGSDQPVTDSEFWACQAAIDEMLEKIRPWRKALPAEIELVAVAGTATTLAAYHLGLNAFEAAQVDAAILTRGDLHRMVEELKWRTPEERKHLPGMEPGRADVILAGALILWRTLEVLEFPRCRVSTRGLRFGALKLDASVSP